MIFTCVRRIALSHLAKKMIIIIEVEVLKDMNKHFVHSAFLNENDFSCTRFSLIGNYKQSFTLD